MTSEIKIHEMGTGRIYRVVNGAGQEVGRMLIKIGDYVHVQKLENHTCDWGAEKIKGVGKMLLQQAIDDGKKERLNLKLQAKGKSIFFFWSLGFRAEDEQLGEQIQKIYEAAIAKGKHAKWMAGSNYSVDMYLPLPNLLKIRN